MFESFLSPSVLLAGLGLAGAGVAAWVDTRSKITDNAARIKILEEEMGKLRESNHDNRELVSALHARLELAERGQPMTREDFERRGR